MLPVLLSFCGAAIVVAMVPGPSTAVIVREALRGGRRAALATLAANELGVLFWACAAALGASALVETSRIAYGVLRWGGAALLLVLGVQSILGRGSASAPPDARAAVLVPAPSPLHGGWSSFRIGLLTILANPKAALFAASFLPQFVPTNAPVLPTMLVLAGTWVVVDTIWYVVLILLVSRVQAVMACARVRRALERVSGTVLIALGVRLALERR
jgi:threonine/homoserine/homoserine lactone efflux protein